jgi:hypothetical protein
VFVPLILKAERLETVPKLVKITSISRTFFPSTLIVDLVYFFGDNKYFKKLKRFQIYIHDFGISSCTAQSVFTIHLFSQ